MDVTFRGNVMVTMPIESRIDFLSVPELKPAAASIQDHDWLFVGRFSRTENSSSAAAEQPGAYLELAARDAPMSCVAAR